MFRWVVILGGSLWAAAFLGSVQAAENTSRYSDLDFAVCEIVEEDSEFGFVQMKCPGAHGYDVYATEADLRIYLSFKPEDFVSVDPTTTDEGGTEEVDGIGQTLPPFNTLGPKLEWRAANIVGAEPFATIVRYHYQTMDEAGASGEGQLLVVSRFREGESCHVAYIDALANSNANQMARDLADTFANSGTCPEGAVPVLGAGAEAFRY
ncbi:MAG: hypothetical protein COA62_03935 [Rhodobiaceae bacterium]|nr:MAG: hypothetical protein COA62_03935 [Rhodobiaceae bacterium]